MFASSAVLADSPDEAAYHLAAAMSCCEPLRQPAAPTNQDRVSEHEILILQQQKVHLERQLQLASNLLNTLPTVLELGSDVKYLNEVIMKLEMQNQQARATGLQNLQAVAAQYCTIENQRASMATRTQQISVIYQQQLHQNMQLRTEIDTVMRRIRQLHDRNNQLVRMFV